MDCFFDEEPSTSLSAVPYSPEAQTVSEALPKGDTSQSSSMNVAEQPPSMVKIRNEVEELVERINSSRSRDQKEMDSYQNNLSDILSEMCQKMKDHLYSVYEDNSVKIEETLAELSVILNNCEQLYKELHEATQALSHLRDTF